MRPLELVRKVAETVAGIRKRRAEGAGPAPVEAAMRVVETTTRVARRARMGPLPPARGFERLALTAARAQLELTANLLGLPITLPREPPPESAAHHDAPPPPSPADDGPPATRVGSEGFLAPREQAIVREEKEAQLRAALGALVSEALALVDTVLAVPPEMGTRSVRGIFGRSKRDEN